MRFFCDSCQHTLAILLDAIIPYSRYSLLFVLRLLGQYFQDVLPLNSVKDMKEISQNQFYKWIALWKSHKQK
ncbi:hypothetical protein DWX30_01245 [Dorea formicigenerans]|nr:hypothetical protein DWX30_01245 [Dorea formicigenerans]RHC52223.1 hypothetical protein DW838_02175 [Dorea formicigenerans]